MPGGPRMVGHGSPCALGQDPESQANQVLCRRGRSSAVHSAQPGARRRIRAKARLSHTYSAASEALASTVVGGASAGSASAAPIPPLPETAAVWSSGGCRPPGGRASPAARCPQRASRGRPPLLSAHRRLQAATVARARAPLPCTRRHPLTLCSHFRARPEHAFRPHEYTHACCPSWPLRLILSVFFPPPHVTWVTPRVNTPPP